MGTVLYICLYGRERMERGCHGLHTQGRRLLVPLHNPRAEQWQRLKGIKALGMKAG